ncbi:MAG TPA: hypothetical protein VH439_02275 [Gemmatimonadales bacterium]|jgi:hypothetical protein
MPPERQASAHEPAGTATSAPASEPVASGKYVAYVLVFGVIFFVLYILPEILIFKQSGFAPVEHLVQSGADPTLGAILSDLWRDRAQLLNPLNNPLVRFFLVTIVAGVVLDQVKKHAPRDTP